MKQWLEIFGMNQASSVTLLANFPFFSLVGLSSMELMMADLESLKLYINYFSTILATPLPQHYDPDLLAQYFASRPHILAFRTIQVRG
jgi:hypothetical protein